MEACPCNALKNEEVKQTHCFAHAFGDDKAKKTWLITCHKCRDICPYNLGTENKNLKF